jgi:hypothetical protein
MQIITIKYRYRLITAIISLMLFFMGCISPFEPDLQGENGLLVVEGSIIKGRETQVIMISKTSPISQPEYLPLENCNVRVMDNTGNEFVFNEELPGKYVANIDDAWLNYDKQYKLIFTTSSGDVYESSYQVLLETAAVDSIYGIREFHYSPKTEAETNSGVQFYVDLDAPDHASRYYRWVLEETWESFVKNKIWAVYDGQTIQLFNPDDSLQHCWKTKDVTGLDADSAVLLSTNRIKKIPLHFVESSSQKLFVKYCATIKQYALNADAYDYWYEKERELRESGNIYAIQPSQPKSNIHNTNNPDELVMGFFWVASSTIKRVFIKNPDPHEMILSCHWMGAYCESDDMNDILDQLYYIISLYPEDLTDPPYYITRNFGTQFHIALTPQCLDCRIVGGDARKPDFWE